MKNLHCIYFYQDSLAFEKLFYKKLEILYADYIHVTLVVHFILDYCRMLTNP